MLKKSWIKNILILSLVLNFIFGALTFYVYTSKEKVNKGIITRYIYNQNNKKDILKKALSNKDNKVEFLNDITMARNIIYENRNIFSIEGQEDNKLKFTKIQEAYLYERENENVLLEIQKHVLENNLTETDYNKILRLIGELDKYVVLLDLQDTNLNKESVKSLTNKVQMAIEKLEEACSVTEE